MRLKQASENRRSQALRGTVRVALRNGTIRRSLSIASLFALDVISLVAGGLVSSRLLGWDAGLLPLLAVVWVLSLACFGMYDRAARRRSPGALLGASMLWAGLSVVGTVLYPAVGIGTPGLLVMFVTGTAACASLRLAFEVGVSGIYSRGIGRVPLLLVGRPEGVSRVRDLVCRDGSPVEPVGEVLFGRRTEYGSLVSLGRLRAALEDTGACEILLTDAEMLTDDELLSLLESARLRGIPLRVVPGAVSLLGSSQRLHEELGIPLLEMRYPGLDNTQRALKRTMDVLISAAGLVLLLPVMVTVWAAIRATSSGDALIRQKRAGADERVFICYKLRTMYRGSDVMPPSRENGEEAHGAAVKTRDDPRITPLGRVLRRWSLDELPQLYNVLKGDMSLVGPRPLPMREFELLAEPHKRRLSVPPGMTGYWQVRGRSNLPFDEMVRLDLYYIENWSLSFDVRIIAKTVGAVLVGRGAY